MRVGDIKNITDDTRIKHFIHYFWDFSIQGIIADHPVAIYRRELSKLENTDDIKVVYDVIEKVYSKYIDYIEVTDAELYKSHRRYMEELCKHVNGYHYEDNMNEEKIALYMERKRKHEESQKQIEERLERLAFLYDVFGWERNGVRSRYDVIRRLARCEELTDIIVKNKDVLISDKRKLYDICEDVIVPKVGSELWNYTFCVIMNSLSHIIYKDRNYWLKKNGIDFESIQIDFKKG